MSKFNRWNVNDNLMAEVLRVKYMSDKQIDIEGPGKVGLGVKNTTIIEPKPSIAEWYAHIRNELKLNLVFKK